MFVSVPVLVSESCAREDKAAVNCELPNMGHGNQIQIL